MITHPSHKTRISLDASSYDEICDLCCLTDGDGGNALSRPCHAAPMTALVPSDIDGPAGEADVSIAWLNEAAHYFENRDTCGEDRAHWANVYNAENARKVAARLAALQAVGLEWRNKYVVGMKIMEDEVASLQRRVETLTGALQQIARQKLSAELTDEDDPDNADYQDGFDAVVEIARAALTPEQGGKP